MRMIPRVLLVLSLAISTLCSAADLPAPEQFHLFLLVGQSNMAGRGQVEEQDKTPHPRVLSMDKTGAWVPAVDPLHFDKPKAVGVGLGKTFATLYAEANPGVTVGLIPCAVGGSPIAAWKPGYFFAATQSKPWDDAMTRAQAALKVGTLKGILWHQGESDCSENLAVRYEAALHDLITRMRTELHAETVPFIAGQMGVFPNKIRAAGAPLVNAAHETLPQKVKLSAFVSSDGLGHKGDKVHFNAEAYREFGRRYYAAFIGVK
jgi:hypothetical protein